MAIPSLFFIYFCPFQSKLLQLTNRKKNYLVSGAGIRTHDPSNVRLLQLPLDQGNMGYVQHKRLKL